MGNNPDKTLIQIMIRDVQRWFQNINAERVGFGIASISLNFEVPNYKYVCIH